MYPKVLVISFRSNLMNSKVNWGGIQDIKRILNLLPNQAILM